MPRPGRTGAAGQWWHAAWGTAVCLPPKRAFWRGAGTRDTRASVDSGVVLAGLSAVQLALG